jgi:ABC-type nickel/cobalt efflux system permease component RcnA
MRTLGAARTSALFGAAPFVGAVLSLLLFRDNLGLLMLIALPLLLTGAVLLIGEVHVHFHQHVETEHEHRHSHDDDHHAHNHETVDNTMIHSHVHRHVSLRHAHAHTPDIHHRHEHSNKA